MNILYKLRYDRTTRRYWLVKWSSKTKMWETTSHYTGSPMFAAMMAVKANKSPDRV